MSSENTILIVDDQLSGREVFRGLLAGEGYNLAFAANGPEALAKASQLTPDIVLLDVMMPEMDGFEVCRRLRSDPHLAEVPVIMVTALDDRDSRLRGIEAGADGFITKPFDHIELKTRVRTITRLNRYRRLLLERSQRQRVEAEIERRRRELQLVNRFIAAITTISNVEDALYIACEALTFAFKLPQATALLLNEQGTEFTVQVVYKAPWANAPSSDFDNKQPSIKTGPLIKSDSLAETLSEYLSQYKMPVAIVEKKTSPHLASACRLMDKLGIGSLLLVPIVVKEQMVSIIELKTPEQRYFSSQDLILTQSMATAVSQAIETHQLHQQVQRYANDLEETVTQRTQELQSERDRTQAILEAVGDAVFVTDVEGTIQYLNPAAVKLTGFTMEDAQGKKWQLWQSRKTKVKEAHSADEHLYDDIVKTVSSGQIWSDEVINKRKDGTLYEARLTVTPLFAPENPGQTIGFVSIQSDITPYKLAERLQAIEQEQEKQKALDRLRHTFLSTVNHEMRSPLALIFQTLEMIEDPQLGPLTEDHLAALSALRRQSWTLGEMVEGLMRVAAFLSKQQPVRPVPGQLKPVLNEVIPLAEFKARSKEITIETDIAPNLPVFPLDVKQLEEVLTQLLDNAIKFNQPKGKVKLSVWANKDWVTIAISDTGVGIEEKQLKMIWDLFEQGTDPLRRAQEGLGLGLALTRYIIEAHNGIIDIETVPNQGSTFTLKLPRKKPAGKEEILL